jgi:hypothetical protein
MGAWALWRQETLILIAATAGLVIIVIGLAVGKRINWCFGAHGHRSADFCSCSSQSPCRMCRPRQGWGVEHWSWFDRPEKQIAELEKVLGEGRRLPVERLMSWSDLRFDGTTARLSREN